MLRLLFVLMMFATSAWAGYYTSMDARLTGDKALYFGKSTTIKLKRNDTLYLESSKDTSWLLNGNRPKEIGRLPKNLLPIFLGEPEKIEENNVTKTIPLDDLKVFNFHYILLHNMRSEQFVVKTDKAYLFVKKDEDMELISHPFTGKDAEVYQQSFKIKKAIDLNGNEISVPFRNILEKQVTFNNSMLGLSIGGQSLQKLTKVVDDALVRFNVEIKKRPITVEAFDFRKEKLYLTYVSKSETGQQRMTAKYEMNKKYIKTVLKAPVSLLDPENKSRSVEEHVGILRDVKRRELFEVKKVQIVDGAIEVAWKNHPKKAVVIVKYKSEIGKDQSILSKERNQQFYSIEGLLYLIHWMADTGKEKKVITFMNGHIPFDATVRRTASGSYSMQKSGQTLYEFKVDSKNFVTLMRYPNYKVDLVLENKDTDSTIANKKYIKKYIEDNGIIYVGK
jgi:hypothetical protein